MKKIRNSLIILIAMSVMAVASGILTQPITDEKMKLLPITQDFRNYFFLQSIDDATNIIIADFTSAEKIITKISDYDSNNEIDEIIDYYPVSKVYRRPTQGSQSSFFHDDLEKLKMQIIDGSIFENYSYEMSSLGDLKNRIEDGAHVRKHRDGYKVIIYDPDAPTTIKSELFFGKRLGRYDLVFKTNYYTVFNSNIKPALVYSVYCRYSKDPVVVEVVESLLEMVR